MEFELRGHPAQHAREPGTQVFQQRSGAGLPHLASHIGRLPRVLGSIAYSAAMRCSACSAIEPEMKPWFSSKSQNGRRA